MKTTRTRTEMAKLRITRLDAKMTALLDTMRVLGSRAVTDEEYQLCLTTQKAIRSTRLALKRWHKVLQEAGDGKTG